MKKLSSNKKLSDQDDIWRKRGWKQPWPVWLSWLGASLQGEGLPDHFQGRTHACLEGMSTVGVEGGLWEVADQWSMFSSHMVFLFLFFSLSLKLNKMFKKQEIHNTWQFIIIKS